MEKITKTYVNGPMMATVITTERTKKLQSKPAYEVKNVNGKIFVTTRTKRASKKSVEETLEN